MRNLALLTCVIDITYVSMTIAVRVHQARTDAGLSARELSKLAGVSNAYVTLLEGGRSAAPSQAIVARLAKVLGTTSDWLGSGIGVAPSPKLLAEAVARARKEHRGDPKAA